MHSDIDFLMYFSTLHLLWYFLLIYLSFVFLLIQKNRQKNYKDAPFDDPEIQEEETVTEKEIVKFKTEYQLLNL